jgi:ABC-type uncharacterized transport system permease subunit
VLEGAFISGSVKITQNLRHGKNRYNGLAISMLAGAAGGMISVTPIPGINEWVAVANMGYIVKRNYS